LKKAKGAGADNITAEHILYADLIIAHHLCCLFNLIILHSYVPAQFVYGIIILRITDRQDNVNKVDDYQAITLSCVISIIFEFCVSTKCSNFIIATICSLVLRKVLAVLMLFMLFSRLFNILIRVASLYLSLILMLARLFI